MDTGERRRLELLHYIAGWDLTYRELATAVGLRSPATVHHHVTRMVRAGWLEREPRVRKSLVVTRDGLAALQARKEPAWRN